jgi:heptosyltransferase-2
LIKKAVLKFNINSNELNILLGIGGSGPTKRIPPKTFLSVMEKIYNFKKSKFFLATGKKDDEQRILNEILSSKFKDKCIPLDNLSIADTLPIIKNCSISICNDSSFSHLSSALGIKTITLMADTPLIYGSYSSNMHPIIPDGETTVSHNTFGKDRINPNKIFDKFLSIIS